MIFEAATCWFPYKDSMFGPRVGEWCLWSAVIDGQRNYFGGSLYERGGDGAICLNWQGRGKVKIDDSLYFARVIKLPAQSTGLPLKQLMADDQPFQTIAKPEPTQFDLFMHELRVFDEKMFKEMGGYLVWAQIKALYQRAAMRRTAGDV